RLERAEVRMDRDRLRTSLDAALTALRHWKHSSSRRRHPREMQHREIVADFLAADLPDAAREVLLADASAVLAELTATLSEHELRPASSISSQRLDAAASHSGSSPTRTPVAATARSCSARAWRV